MPALPVLASDLLEPTGDLVAAHFPADVDVEERLSGYLADGAARLAAAAARVAPLVPVVLDAEQTKAALTAWAYHRAYAAIYVRMLASPASASLADQGSVSYLASQLASWATLRDEYRNAFDALVPGAGTEASTRPSAAPLASVQTSAVCLW